MGRCHADQYSARVTDPPAASTLAASRHLKTFYRLAFPDRARELERKRGASPTGSSILREIKAGQQRGKEKQASPRASILLTKLTAEDAGSPASPFTREPRNNRFPQVIPSRRGRFSFQTRSARKTSLRAAARNEKTVLSFLLLPLPARRRVLQTHGSNKTRPDRDYERWSIQNARSLGSFRNSQRCIARLSSTR